jgi:hypothetical protein
LSIKRDLQTRPSGAKQYHFFLLFFIIEMLAFARLEGQQIKPPVLIGVGKGVEKLEGFGHFYAVNSAIVDMAYGKDSPLLSRAFVVQTTRTECPPQCPPPEKTGPSCWRCCDGTWICTDDSRYDTILERSAKAQKQWPDYKNRLEGIEGWPAIEAALQIDPPLEISKADPRIIKFSEKMGIKQ